MSRPLLPPRGIFTGTRWLYDPQLSPNIKETLLQLMALTWGSDGHTTPPLSYAQLEALTHKDARTLRGHFSALRTYHAALRLQRAGTGQFIIALADWLFRNETPALAASAPAAAADSLLPCQSLPGKSLPLPVKDDQNQEEEFLTGKDLNLHLPVIDHDQPAAENTPVAKRGKTRPGQPRSGLTRGLETRLREAGVFPVLLSEVGARAAQAGYGEAEIGALLDWCLEDQPERAAALFIGRLRAGARAPAAYSKPACPRCGLRGKHEPECPRRYALDTL